MPPTNDDRPPASPARGYRSPGARKEHLKRRSYSKATSAGPQYVELHAASAFSFLDGASLPEDLVERAAALGLPAVALVGRQRRLRRAALPPGGQAGRGPGAGGGRGGALRARSRRSSSDAPLGPLRPLGLVPEPAMPGAAARRRAALPPPDPAGREPHRLPEPLPPAHRRARSASPRARRGPRWEQLAAHAEGLHCLTGGDEGPVARALADGGPDAARRLLERLAALFPGRLHVELQRHRLREEEHRNQAP